MTYNVFGGTLNLAQSNPIHSICSCGHFPDVYSSLVCLFQLFYHFMSLPSVLWQCWLGIRKGIRLVKN